MSRGSAEETPGAAEETPGETPGAAADEAPPPPPPPPKEDEAPPVTATAEDAPAAAEAEPSPKPDAVASSGPDRKSMKSSKAGPGSTSPAAATIAAIAAAAAAAAAKKRPRPEASPTESDDDEEGAAKKVRRVPSPPPAVFMTRSKEEELFDMWARVPTFRRSSAAEEAHAAASRVAERAGVKELRPVYDWGWRTPQPPPLRLRLDSDADDIKLEVEMLEPQGEGEAEGEGGGEEEEEAPVMEDWDPDFVEREALMVDESPFDPESSKEALGYTYVVPYPDTSLIDVEMREALGLVPKPTKPRSDVSDHSSVSDPGIETAFEEPAGTDTDFRDDVGERHYRYMCDQLDVIPSKHFIRQLRTDTASFRYYGLDPRAIRPITECLEKNVYVKYLDLEDNWLIYDSACHLVDLFRVNDTIEGLNLTGCRLGPQSAWKLRELLLVTSRLRELLLSNNALGDAGVVALADGIGENTSVCTLDLSRNHLGRGAATALGAALHDNWALKTLDLSWNSLFDTQGFRRLVDGLIENQGIETLNLAGNALGPDVLEILTDLLTQNMFLQNLDLSFNRLDDECISGLRQPIAQSEILHVLKLGNNPISYSEAGALLTAIQKSPSNVLELLDMEGIWVNKKFKVSEAKIQEQRPFSSVTAGVVSNYEVKDPDRAWLLLKRAYFEGMSPKKKKQRKDFGHFLLRAPKDPIPIANFIELVLAENIRMTETLCKSLGRQFFDEKRRVDIRKMTEKYMEYFPDTKLPPPPEPKQKKGKKGKKGKKDKKGKKGKGDVPEETPADGVAREGVVSAADAAADVAAAAATEQVIDTLLSVASTNVPDI